MRLEELPRCACGPSPLCWPVAPVLMQRVLEAQVAGADEHAAALLQLRGQLVAAVQKEVTARGAAQEMAGLLREQQAKLSALAEQRREMGNELARSKSPCSKNSSRHLSIHLSEYSNPFDG